MEVSSLMLVKLIHGLSGVGDMGCFNFLTVSGQRREDFIRFTLPHWYVVSSLSVGREIRKPKISLKSAVCIDGRWM